jgi:subfamily B ATP-binding cassette protein MsbA
MGKVINQQMKEAALLTSYLLEIFKNHKLIKIFQREDDEKIKADKYLNNLKEYNKKINIVFVRSSPIMEAFTGFIIAIIIFISAKLVSNNELEVSNFFSFLAAMMLAYQPVRSLATLNIAIKQGIVGARRVLSIVDNKNKIKNKDGAKELIFKSGNIEFKNVVFNYKANEQKVLKSINLNIPAQKMTALVGHSGAGKSTILNLIPRFYNVDQGDITIDDQSIYNVTVHSLRKYISLVSQETTLFDDTIKNNISYAKPNASLKEIEEAAKFAFADEFINKLPDKYDTIIGENGTRLSGGEKQRVSIARAIIKKSPIILLDEATSSLDADTESKIQKAISFLTKGKTTIVIAHRLSTILNSDKIFVINKGQVVSEGNHTDLLSSSEIYKNFYEKQVKKG